MAFEFVDKGKDDTLKVFAAEVAVSGGGRKYVVASYEEFWRRYNNTVFVISNNLTFVGYTLLNESSRHYYEVIR